MATSLLALLDDIATVLDDAALLAKVAAKKTTGVLGDDLALNADQVAGVHAERELPVVWAVAKGSLKNKAILVPAALALSEFAPRAVTPLLMCGGLYLCYEGVEKLAHKLLRAESEDAAAKQALAAALADPKADLVALEKEKIAGAIRTDFVLSAEIVIIALGASAGAGFVARAGALVAIALAMTAFVYGFVAAIVKLDDLGLILVRRRGGEALGKLLLAAAPALMRALSVAGTAAMFLVGGGIIAHGLPFLPHAHGPAKLLLDAGVGVAAGAAALACSEAFSRARKAARR